MFTCTLEPAGRTPLCEQLYTALKREMERGGIRPGERMPSKRELAAHLSVSTATVEAACEQVRSARSTVVLGDAQMRALRQAFPGDEVESLDPRGEPA